MLTIIIPALDEADSLPRLLERLARQVGVDYEVIVADGGSSDATVDIARRHGARIVHSSSGRARQMNAAAMQARGRWLLFLHADCLPERDTQLREALQTLAEQPDPRVAGHFPLRFERSQDGHGLLYHYMEEKSASNRPYTINGDQGLLIARQWFEALGGFDERLPFLEDQRIAARIREAGRWLVLPGRLLTSARRFETEGPITRYILMAIIMAMHVTDMDDFFARATTVYQRQGETGRLLLTPYFRLLRRLMRDMGWRAATAKWLEVGDFALHQSWQLFFVIDVAARRWLGPGRYPFTAFHDRVFARLAHHRLGAVVTALLVFGYSMGLLAPWYRWRERQHLQSARR